MCLLKGYNPSYLIYIKGAYWSKVSIERKCAY